MTTAHTIKHLGTRVELTWQSGAEKRRVWIERSLLERIKTDLYYHPSTGCWVWQGLFTEDKRPMISVEGQLINVRRLLYDAKYGPLSGRNYLTPDCPHQRCCNPDHQKAMARGPVVGTMGDFDATGFDVCAKGHALTPDNAYVYNGKKLCRRCRAIAERHYRQRVKFQG